MGMATHCSILAWRIPWTEEPGGLQSMGLQRVRYDCSYHSAVQCVFDLDEEVLPRDFGAVRGPSNSGLTEPVSLPHALHLWAA